ncbi:MAG: hypothetical protein JXB48_24020 [Candidatus Latescibacteria bacterium]|nr:hypothetical protein [Candidatus Latescibacterota bacterium]
MTRIILAFSLFLHIHSFLFAAESVPTDTDLCMELLKNSIEHILSGSVDNHSTTVQLLYTNGYSLSNRTRTEIEAIFTNRGFSISGSYNKADCMCDIAITDCSIILRKIDSSFRRTAALTVHVKCTDSKGIVLFASGKRESVSDNIPSKETLLKTDNGSQFSRDVKRIVISKKLTFLKAISLIMITLTLAYYASQ